MDFNELKVTADQALLELQADELDSLAGEFREMLSYMTKMDEADTGDIEPTSHASGSSRCLRNDVPFRNGDQRQALLDQAPEISGSSINVPRVLP